jgi:hypothetical protein
MSIQPRFGGTFLIDALRLSEDAKLTVDRRMYSAKLFQRQDNMIMLDAAGSYDGFEGMHMADQNIMQALDYNSRTKGHYIFIPEALSTKSQEYRNKMFALAKEFFKGHV